MPANGSALDALYAERFPTSVKRYEKACKLFPSGVTHDSRYLAPFPVYIKSAKAAHKTDVDNHDLIDYWMGHGALLLGHSHPTLVAAVQGQVEVGTHWGACHELELEWAEWINKLVPSSEMVRFTSSGTESTMMALRIARLVTGKQNVIKFAGHFHGWHDSLIPAAEPPHDNGDYSQPGITQGVMSDLIISPPNDLEALSKLIDEHDPACVICEATGGRWGVVPLRKEFLLGLRKLTEEKGVLLVMDEVISGFRVHPGGVQGLYDIKADLTTLAKILAGGLPGGCVAGRADLMEALSFTNRYGKKMKHHGTFNANPLSAAAGCAMLEQVATGKPCKRASEVAKVLRREFNNLFAEKNINWAAYGDYAMFKIIPNYEGPRPESEDFLPYENDFQQVDRPIEKELSHAFRKAMLVNGLDFMGWGAMTSSAHSDKDVDQTIESFSKGLDLLKEHGFV
ncbi:Glutamate-1-semialdehyde 2,1-aminomutase [Polystyrenella longa]|uniref:Glutamate-1-semialdehyde 2,1-aminomutase n=1 Tax=Polystyrenella longa TaxID=2528007 RepID=A0A518CHG3_9PLAN|nr:aspartate aminotransferase family protein [Polystyrenella longa]QDU78668.1 Glutamate-1-semialdehyde 2,1-aminomutase [Polystyrenella longa]